MNIKLLYHNSSCNIDIFKDTTIAYLYKMAEKIFKKPLNNILIYYKKKELPNNSYFIYSVILKENNGLNSNLKSQESILVKDKISLTEKNENISGPNSLNNNNKFPSLINSQRDLLNKENYLFEPRKSNLSPMNLPGRRSLNYKNNIKKLIGSPKDSHNKQKLIIKCQICNIKNAVFYCRNCNLFICFECNVRYQEHKDHLHINLEDGNINTGYDIYKESINEYWTKTQKAYQLSNEWMISNVDRDHYLEKLFNLLDQIKTGAFVLSNKSTGYKLNDEMLTDFKADLEEIQRPKFKEEIIEIFFRFNTKENEMNNYIKCVDLQIIKSEFTKKLIELLKKVEENFNIIIDDFQQKLIECENMKEFSIKI